MAYVKHLRLIVAFLGALILLTGANLQKPEVRSASETHNYYASQLEKSGVRLHSEIKSEKKSLVTSQTKARCKALVYRALNSLPASHKELLQDLTLSYSTNSRRGLGGGDSIVLRCLNVADAELSAVLVHEIGHLVDGSFLKNVEEKTPSGFLDFGAIVYEGDPSAAFYRISWLSESQKLPLASILDFVSEYAATDPFEDFAETYAYYRLHGPEFRALADKNTALAQKYEFVKLAVFDGDEFGVKEKAVKVDTENRNYDVTVLPYKLSDFYKAV